MHSKVDLQPGRILIAQPYLHAPPFTRSVILLADYSPEEGAVGFILNKPLQLSVERLISDFPRFNGLAWYGGPVQTNTIHYIHTYGDLLEDSTPIGYGLYWGGNFEKLKIFVERKLITGNKIRFYVGYSGWAPGQLEDELQRGSWFVGHGDRNYVFKVPFYKCWKTAMENQGDIYTVLSEIPMSWQAKYN